MRFGYNGKILKVDLTKRTWEAVEYPESFYRQYLGGSNIALYHMLREMPAGADPLGPDNLLSFAVGVVTGAPFPGNSRVCINAKSPQTGAIGDTQAGGFFPAEMKAAGYDALLFKGKASSPVYLWVKDGEVEIREAAHLWGNTTGDTEDMIRAELGDGKIQMAEIGPAGETLSRIAAVMTMANRAGGRKGLGAVMGSKNLKAVAVRGTHRPRVADPPALKRLARKGAENVELLPVMKMVQLDGTAGDLPYQQLMGSLPTRNWRSGSFEHYLDICGETITRTILKKRETCYACPVHCKRAVEITEGKFLVDPRYGGPEYESVAALGSSCGIGDLAAIAKANELCNQYGLDTISAGCTIAWAMDCFERGLIASSDTGGIDLRFGNGDALVELVEQMGCRKGFGALLAEGSAEAARRLGRGTEELVVAVKDAELPMHMPEVKRSLGLCYAVVSFGADHQSSEYDPSYTEEAAEIEKQRLAVLGLTSPQGMQVLNDEKVRYFYVTQKLYSITDILCVCQFDWGPAWQMYGPNDFVDVVRAVTGWDVTLDELLTAGERRVNLLRVFNAREGFTRRDDTLPPKVYLPKEGGASNGLAASAEELERAKDTYYRMAGWDVATGNPTPEKLEELGLSWATAVEV